MIIWYNSAKLISESDDKIVMNCCYTIQWYFCEKFEISILDTKYWLITLINENFIDYTKFIWILKTTFHISITLSKLECNTEQYNTIQ